MSQISKNRNVHLVAPRNHNALSSGASQGKTTARGTKSATSKTTVRKAAATVPVKTASKTIASAVNQFLKDYPHYLEQFTIYFADYVAGAAGPSSQAYQDVLKNGNNSSYAKAFARSHGWTVTQLDQWVQGKMSQIDPRWTNIIKADLQTIHDLAKDKLGIYYQFVSHPEIQTYMDQFSTYVQDKAVALNVTDIESAILNGQAIYDRGKTGRHDRTQYNSAGSDATWTRRVLLAGRNVTDLVGDQIKFEGGIWSITDLAVSAGDEARSVQDMAAVTVANIMMKGGNLSFLLARFKKSTILDAFKLLGISNTQIEAYAKLAAEGNVGQAGLAPQMFWTLPGTNNFTALRWALRLRKVIDAVLPHQDADLQYSAAEESVTTGVTESNRFYRPAVVAYAMIHGENAAGDAFLSGITRSEAAFEPNVNLKAQTTGFFKGESIKLTNLDLTKAGNDAVDNALKMVDFQLPLGGRAAVRNLLVNVTNRIENYTTNGTCLNVEKLVAEYAVSLTGGFVAGERGWLRLDTALFNFAAFSNSLQQSTWWRTVTEDANGQSLLAGVVSLTTLFLVGQGMSLSVKSKNLMKVLNNTNSTFVEKRNAYAQIIGQFSSTLFGGAAIVDYWVSILNYPNAAAWARRNLGKFFIASDVANGINHCINAATTNSTITAVSESVQGGFYLLGGIFDLARLIESVDEFLLRNPRYTRLRNLGSVATVAIASVTLLFMAYFEAYSKKK